MKRVIVSLIVFMMMFSFAVAGSNSSIRSDFYIQEEGMTGGYEEDVGDISYQGFGWLPKIIHWGIIIVVLGILIKFLKMVGKKPKSGTLKKRTKKSRRKKA